MGGFHWIASYPKSGNTWLRLGLLSLSRGGAPIDFSQRVSFAPFASARVLFDAALHVESGDLTESEATALRPRLHEAEAATAPGPLLRKVHDAWIMTPRGEPLFAPALTLSTVYLVRDPRDVAVSLAHHKAVPLDAAVAFLGDPEARMFPAGRSLGNQVPQRLLSWSGHVESWLDAPGMTAPLLVRYEDMLADPAAMLARAAGHLGWTVDGAAVARAVAATRFDALRAEENRNVFLEKPQEARRFFRRGVAGSWRDTLSPAQVARIEREHGLVMTRMGYN